MARIVHGVPNPSHYGFAVTLRTESTGGTFLITIDRPERRNAVDLETLTRMREAIASARSEAARVVVITGAAPAFCSGADLAGVELGEFTDTLLAVLQALVDLPAIVVAAVDGPALGAGSQIAAACDLRVATPESRFGIPAAKLGLAVDRWTVERVGREAGWSTARRMLLTGETFGAGDLLGGFVHRLGDLAEAREWAGELARLAPLTIAAHKAALAVAGGETTISIDEAESARLVAWVSADAAEGRRAFAEKRPPRFEGR